MAKHNEVGKAGEDIAAAFLERKGYAILERNYRYLKAEIDIIAQTENWIVGVEVKTRNNSGYGKPQEFIGPRKIELLRSAFNHYIETNQIDCNARFDVIGIIKNSKELKIEHLEDVSFYF